MNITIPIEVSGDIWYNEQSVRQQLGQLSGNAEITLDLRSEGPSLYCLGITAVVDAWLTQHRLPPNTITVTRWSNGVEPIAYKKLMCSVPSHFWYFAQKYQNPPEYNFNGLKSQLFGLFFLSYLSYLRYLLYNPFLKKN